ncbi:hypothetical protein Zmor_019871 [Zophobas morio]|uniref:Uncharacterized protein n=1 Tax=Zophobas morio TaxID=2755281 RepID=A0AA38M8W3_9CUCU|nr:hypothetical protein Zmor_019871 [Zophobas morio]
MPRITNYVNASIVWAHNSFQMPEKITSKSARSGSKGQVVLRAGPDEWDECDDNAFAVAAQGDFRFLRNCTIYPRRPYLTHMSAIPDPFVCSMHLLYNGPLSECDYGFQNANRARTN